MASLQTACLSSTGRRSKRGNVVGGVATVSLKKVYDNVLISYIKCLYQL